MAAIISFVIGESILQGARPEISSFALIHFAAYLWFLLMPVEALVPILMASGHSHLPVFVVAVTTALLALAIDYAFGLLVPRRWFERFIEEKRRDKYQRYLEGYGKYVIFFFAATPLSSPILTLISGAIRYPFRQLMAYTLAGLAFKYALLVLIGGLL